MNKQFSQLLDILLYVVVFFIIQYVVTALVGAVDTWLAGRSMQLYWTQFAHGMISMSTQLQIASVVLSSILTLCVFVYSKWATVSRVWLASHPWAALCWVVWLALGTILPSEWLNDQLNLTMPDATVRLFEQIMGHPAGYIAVGILAPLTEEVVFRGAILRQMLRMFPHRSHWIPIFISALLFGAVHMNMPQLLHATLMGLILGWLYYRTDSVLPGVVFHWVNNTVAYVMFNLMPQMADGKLIDLFHGQASSIWMGLGFSLCIIIPSVFQLNLRLKKN